MNNNIFLKKLFKKAGIAFVCYCLFFMSFLMFGCSMIGNTSKEDVSTDINTDSGTNNTSESGTEENSAIEEEITAGEETSMEEETAEEEAEEDVEESAEEDTEEEQAEAGEITINVYYSDQMAQYLIAESKVILSGNKYIDALYELMKKPIDSTLTPLLPGTTKINSVTIEGGNAKVDLSQEFLDDRFISDTVDRLLVGSIANTLTQFPEVNSITLYINGEKLNNLGGLDITDPIFRKNDLIKNN